VGSSRPRSPSADRLPGVPGGDAPAVGSRGTVIARAGSPLRSRIRFRSRGTGAAQSEDGLRLKMSALTEAEAAAQAELQRIVEELDAIRSCLQDMHAKLPVSAEETAMLLGEKEMDVATEVRSVIECVLNDSIQPAIRDLAAAASYRPPEKEN